MRLIDNGDDIFSMCVSLTTGLTAIVDSITAKLATDAFIDRLAPSRCVWGRA